MNINIDTLSIKNNGNEKFFINQYKIFALNITTALLQYVEECLIIMTWYLFFREYFQSIFFLSKVYSVKIKIFEKM